MKKPESEQRLLNITKRFARYGIGKELPPKEEVEEMKKEGILFLISDVFWSAFFNRDPTKGHEAFKAHQDLFFWMTTFVCNTVGLSSYKKIYEALKSDKVSMPGLKECCPLIIKETILDGKLSTGQDQKEELYAAAAVVHYERDLIWLDMDKMGLKAREFCSDPTPFITNVKERSEVLIDNSVEYFCLLIFNMCSAMGTMGEHSVKCNALRLLKLLISISLTRSVVEEWVKEWEKERSN